MLITSDLSAAEYIAGYRDAAKFEALCRQCPNYGRSWLCPPFNYDVDDLLSPYAKVHIAGMRIDIGRGHAIDEAMELMLPARIELSRYLLAREAELNGRACGFAGQCLYCQACSRHDGEPCRHPEWARPSLEAYGFDLGATASRLLGFDLQWATSDTLPERLALIGAVFY